MWIQLLLEKIIEVETRDQIKNFQPPVSGELIMETFHLKPCKEVGIIKNEIKEAILEGKIQNNFEEAKQLMFEIAENLGLSPIAAKSNE